MILLILTIAITCIALYLLTRFDEKHSLDGFLIFVVIFGFCIIPSLSIFTAFDYFNIEGLNVIPATLPLILFGLFAVWATWGESGGKSDTENKKDSLVSDAIILTTVLSENENSNDSSSSNSNSSSSSSSSDDFFIL